MSNLTVERFLKDLRDSGVVPEESLQPLLGRHQGEDPRGLALSLVQAGLLTDWQAKFILSGRSRLRVGNYLLEERTQRDELGDCFIAWHQPLHRRVQLQILSEKVTRTSPEFAAVTNSVGALTDLDHPRVEQTFDVGEDGGRLFVVHEKVAGQRLDSPAKLVFTQGEAAGFIQGVSSGLAHLQSRSVGHGNLAGGALVLADDGLGKIAGLCESTLRRAIGLEHATASGELLSLDRRQWVEIAERLLAKYFRAVEFAQWSQLLQESLADPKKLDLLAEQVAGWRRDLKPTDDQSDLDFFSESKETTESVVAQPVTAVNTQKIGKASAVPSKSVGRVEIEDGSSVNRWLNLYSLVTSSLVLVGLLGYLAWKFWPMGAEKNSQVAVASNQPPVELPKLVVPPETTKRGEQPPLPKLPVEGQLPETEKPQLPTTLPSLQVPETNVPPKQEAAADSKPNPVGKPEQKSAEQLPGKDAGTGAKKKDPFLIPGQETKPGSQPEAKSESKSETKPAMESGQPVSPPAASGDSKPAQTSNSLDSFPKIVKLGEIGQGTQVLGPLPGLKFEELTLRLRYDPESVARSRVFFELQPQSEQQVWKVALKKREDALETEPVGEFRLAEGQLQFAWATEVDARSLALSLANCLLQLETSQGALVTSILREPIVIEGFTLDPKSLTAECAFDLPGAPNEDSVKFKLGPFLADSGWAGGSVVNENFEAKQPAVVVFSSVESEQLFGLEFDRRMRAKVELSADWIFRALAKPQKLKAAEFQRFVDEASAAYGAMVAESDRATRAAEDAITGTKTRMREQATKVKNAMLEAKKQNELVLTHKAAVDGISGQEIPVRLIYQFEDREIVLAETAAGRAAAAAPPPVEKPKSSDENKEKNRRRED